MTEPSEPPVSSADAGPWSGRIIAHCLATCAFVCASYTAVASTVLIVFTRTHPNLDAIQLPGGLIFRALLFGAVSAGAALALWRLRGPHPDVSVPRLGAGSWSPITVLTLLLLLITVLLGLRISDYPWAAPDEVHHLVVARNVAAYGSYASGHPDTGLLYFDSFDSVGPAVIGPIAAAFHFTGIHLASARWVMVGYFLLLCLAQYRFARGLFGPWPTVAGVALLLGTYSSIYLGRTLYGEVPGYAFLILGLLAWRKTLGAESRRGMAGWGLASGALVALAVLSKTILILVGFSFLGAALYDRVTRRTLGLRHVLYPVLGGAAVLAAWGILQRVHGAGHADSGSTLAIYQHYLLFGVSGLSAGIRNAVLPHPLAHLAWMGVATATVPVLFRRHHDLPALVLYLYALFLLYWWFFFTPGQLHRYLWNAYAILALFAGPWLCHAIAGAFRRDVALPRRLISAVIAVALAAPGAHWIALQTREIVTKNEMAPEYALAEAVAALPDGVSVATNVDRLPGLLNFFATRRVQIAPDAIAALAGHDVVITRDSEALRKVLPPGCRVKSVGSFVLLSTRATAEWVWPD